MAEIAADDLWLRFVVDQVNLFWRHEFGEAVTVPWTEFLLKYKEWLKATFPDVLDDREFEALMSREAEKALESELTEGDKQNKTVSGCMSGSVSDMLGSK